MYQIDSRTCLIGRGRSNLTKPLASPDNPAPHALFGYIIVTIARAPEVQCNGPAVVGQQQQPGHHGCEGPAVGEPRLGPRLREYCVFCYH
jgi:hypothetical protein